MTTPATLPADPDKEGNVWCDSCQKSLTAARAGAHLISKAHLTNAEADDSTSAAPSKPAKTSKSSAAPKGRKKPAKVEEEQPDDEEDEAPAEKKKPAKKVVEKKETGVKVASAKGHGLPRDPHKDGNFWCGICEVSLTPSKAEGHMDTARHMANEDKTVAAAVSKLKIAK